MKDANVVEMIRGVVLWSIWLKRDRLIFRDGNAKSLQVVGSHIISLVQFWCKNQKYDACNIFKYIIPCDAEGLAGNLLTNFIKRTGYITYV